MFLIQLLVLLFTAGVPCFGSLEISPFFGSSASPLHHRWRSAQVNTKNHDISSDQQYQKYWSKLSNYQLSKADYEHLFQNKTSYRLVQLFATSLISTVSDQIGLNELRRSFHLKPKSIYCISAEEPNPPNFPLNKDGLNKLQNFMNEKKPIRMDWFRMDEIDDAERFLDNTLPEIRWIYRMKFSENQDTTLTPSIVDKIADDFWDTHIRLFDIVHAINMRST